jgi:hypothetical protein
VANETRQQPGLVTDSFDLRRRARVSRLLTLGRSASRSRAATLGGRDVRKVTFGGANSLDNYIARADHSVDWLLWGEEAAAVMADYWKAIDTVLMGRKT